jgi:nitrite reductase/ring-hydroxylating ferredoxin subunit
MRREARVRLEELDAAPGRFLRVALDVPAWMPNGALVTSVLVGRVAGDVRAYANVCRHHPLPLDFGADSAMGPDGRHLVCHQHGAVYRPADGLCVDGPCRGETLFEATVEVDGVEVVVSLEG